MARKLAATQGGWGNRGDEAEEGVLKTLESSAVAKAPAKEGCVVVFLTLLAPDPDGTRNEQQGVFFLPAQVSQDALSTAEWPCGRHPRSLHVTLRWWRRVMGALNLESDGITGLTVHGGWVRGVTLEAEGSGIGDKDSDQLSSESGLLGTLFSLGRALICHSSSAEPIFSKNPTKPLS